MTILPSPPTPFIGRETDLTRLMDHLRRPTCRWVTLVGIGGVGKTRLAVEVGRAVEALFSDGVYFVSLRAIESEALLLSTIASLFSLHGQDVFAYLKNKNCLLILDNFEHLVGSVEILLALLEAAPEVKLLVTSREALNVRQEWQWLVRGLAYPAAQVDAAPGEYSAIQLFVECAHRIRPDFSLAGEQAAVIQVCQLVEGIPLALELASSWLNVLSCSDIAAEIQRGVGFLRANVRDLPPYHTSMRVVFEQSWTLLSEEERRVFSRLFVFHGGFGREAAAGVAGATLTVLSALVNKSFVRRDADGRYYLHELLRQFAREQLNGSEHDIRAAHSTYYLNLLYDLTDSAANEHQLTMLRAVEPELDNIRAAWGWAVEQGEAAALHRAAYTLHEFLDFRGRYREGQVLFGQAIARVENIPSAQPTLAILLAMQGWFYIRLGQYDQAQDAFDCAQEVYENRKLTPPSGLGTAPLTGLAMLAVLRGSYQTAAALAENTALQKDPQNQQLAVYVLANAHFNQGQHETAWRYAEQAYQMVQVTRNLWMMGYIHVLMGDILAALEQNRLARQHYEQGYQIKEQFNDPEGIAFALNRLARLVAPEEAEPLYQRTRDIYQKINDYGGLATSLHGLGETAFQKEDDRTAGEYLSQALQIAVQIQWLPFTLTILVSIGKLLRRHDSALADQLFAFVMHHPAAAQTLQIEAQKLCVSAVPPPPELNALAADAGARLKSLAAKPQPLIDPLSLRELEILRLLADGLSNQDIAERLILTVGTVKAHNHNIFSKLGTHNRVQAIARARALKIIP